MSPADRFRAQQATPRTCRDCGAPCRVLRCAPCLKADAKRERARAYYLAHKEEFRARDAKRDRRRALLSPERLEAARAQGRAAAKRRYWAMKGRKAAA